jgi:hypothetical protein
MLAEQTVNVGLVSIFNTLKKIDFRRPVPTPPSGAGGRASRSSTYLGGLYVYGPSLAEPPLYQCMDCYPSC